MSKITTKTIISDKIEEIEEKTLYNSNFYIKDYQRGYRWEPKQVEDLLEDIYTFSEEDPKLKYCLQPLIVKKIENISNQQSLSVMANGNNDNEVNDENFEKKNWELIDGQQRLTTIWLILNICNEMMARPKPLPYNIFYENVRLIDNEYITIAKETIGKWFSKFGPVKDDKIYLIQSTIRNRVQFIWYEVDQNAHSNDIFKKINIGKIPLTNAELFKAQLLNRDTLNETKEKTNVEFEKIAMEWDKIEQSLHDNDFWYFISNDTNDEKTRIDFLLELKAKQIQNEEKIETKIQENDNLFSFITINNFINKKHLENPEKSIFELQVDIWKEIVQIHDTLKAFSKNQETYHYIGFLVCIKTKSKDTYIEQLISKIKNKKKSEIKTILLNDVYNELKKIDLNRLDYETDKIKIKNVLLFFNIFTLVESLTDSKFSFKNFKDKKTSWDIEHIHARATDQEILQLNDINKRIELLNGIKIEFANLDYKDKIEEIDEYIEQKLNPSNPKITSEQFLKFYCEMTDLCGDFDENGIGNLTLLDSKTNRSYGNNLYPSKRREIIKRDKGEIFIPVCTKNVFLKMYTEKADNMMKWTNQDALDYKNAIQDALDKFKNIVEEANK